MDKGANIDKIFINLGSFGRWQILQISSIVLNIFHIPQAAYVIVNAGYTPPHWCKHPLGNDSTLVLEGSCHFLNTTTNETLKCLYGYDYDITKTTSSIVSTWNLVCDMDYLPQLSQTIYMAGSAVGGYVFSHLSDKYGRKVAYLSSMSLLVAMEIICGFSPNIVFFTVCRFLTGLAQVGMGSCIFVWIMEICPQNKSCFVFQISQIIFAIALCLAPCVGYVFKDLPWQCSLTTYGVCSLVNIYQIWFLDESVRWLLAKGKLQSAIAIVSKAMKLNNVDLREKEAIERLLVDKDFYKSAEEKYLTEKLDVPVMSFLDILKHSNLRWYCFISWFLWITVEVAVNGFILMANALSGNRYLNFFLMSLVVLISKASMFAIINRFSRKRLIAAMFVSCTGVMLAAVVVSIVDQDLESFLTGCSIAACFLMSCCSSILWMYTLELYPTELRTIGFASALSCSAVASTISPFASYIVRRIKWVPGTVVAVMCFTSVCLLTLLPETRGKCLMQTLDEVDNIRKTPKKK